MTDFARLDVQQSLTELAVDASAGLAEEEVTRRRAQHGRNALPADKGINWLQLVLGQFRDLMVIILLVAAGISWFLGDVKDVVVILAIVLLNAALGISQEYRAEQALAALGALQVPQVRVRRQGTVRQIGAEELVPGDIVLLQEGDRVPADGRLIESVNLQLEEAALTGESVPVEKQTEALAGEADIPLGDRANMAWMGTSVNYGRGVMAVTQTGLATELGNIAAMLLQVERGITPLQRRINRLGKTLAIGAGIVVVLVFIAGLLRGIAWQEMFLTSISLAVAAVPEGLPALITISLSLGAGRMVRNNALIRRLPAVETLGSVTVICSDKTGTLTRNEMTATVIALPHHADLVISGIGYNVKGDIRLREGGPLPADSLRPEGPRPDRAVIRVIQAIALSTNAYLEESGADDALNVVGDTTEGALLVAARKAGITREALERELPRVAELPFSSERKAMTTLHEVRGEHEADIFPEARYIAITKGAPDQLLEWATQESSQQGTQTLTAERRTQWRKNIDNMAQQGLRVIGVAWRPLAALPETLTPEIERELSLLALVGIVDPARPEARAAVHTARGAGLRTIMITGDHALTAEAIARDLDILGPDEQALTGTQLDALDDEQLRESLQLTSTFARVSPLHKLRLVQALQEQGETVAMTGDGVNDAPALKQADIGVAMGITGTDVSKGAAEMVLTDDNFASIVRAVEEGRVIYDNIRKFVKYLLSCNVGEILVMFVALLIGLKIPLLAIQILWVNLVTDGLPAIALGFEPGEADVMRRKPRARDESILAGGTGKYILRIGVLIAILTLVSYAWGYSSLGMQPFSETLGLEQLLAADLRHIVDEAFIPMDWDSVSPEQRVSTWLSSVEPAAEGSGEGLLAEAQRIPRSIAFTVLALTQMFAVMAVHAGERASLFHVGFHNNPLLPAAIILTALLQLLVIYLPALQPIFETAAIPPGHLLVSVAMASLVLVAVELQKRFFPLPELEAH